MVSIIDTALAHNCTDVACERNQRFDHIYNITPTQDSKLLACLGEGLDPVLHETWRTERNSLTANLAPERRESLMRDFIAYHEGFKTELGVAMPREYLVTIGVRK
jgi:hypothetical protein